MKKILCLFSALALMLTSCSSDDSSSEAASGTLLPTKIVETSVENGKSGSVTYTATYDGNKLKEIKVSDASRSVFTYTGDLITKVELYYSSELQSTDVYAYENGKLISKITTKAFGSGPKQKLTFVYNANGTVNANQSQIDDNGETKFDTTTLYTFANGNMISSEIIDGVLREKITSTFDDKKSPFVNVTGLKLLLDLDNNLEFDFYSANNNVKSVTQTYDNEGVLEQTATVATTNKYNNSNFLTEAFVGDATDSYKIEVTY